MAILDVLKKKKESSDKKRPIKKADVKIKPVKEEKEKKITAKRILKESSIAPSVLVSPHITEKATVLAGGGVYIFKISSRSNKIMVKQAIKELYGVSPEKVRIIQSPSKKRNYRGYVGERAGHKKAMVYLKKGDKIEF